MPTQEICPQLVPALEEIGAGDFRVMMDVVRPEVVRPVMYEPVFFEADGRLASQKLIYTQSVASKPKSAGQAIDRVASAVARVDSRTNLVKLAIEQRGEFSGDSPELVEEIRTAIDAQQTTNTARVVGGLLLVKDVTTSLLGMRYVYNRALLDLKMMWELRDYAIAGGLSEQTRADARARNPDSLGTAAATVSVFCESVATPLKPALIFAPSLGLRGM